MKEKRTFVLGDPHGAYRALMQCVNRSGFNPQRDRLICLGDVVDGWSEAPEIIEYLLSIEDFVSIRGNHDDWCHQWLKFGIANPNWLSQGGQATYDAYVNIYPDLMMKHESEFFSAQDYYFVDSKNRLFVHGGFDFKQGLEYTEKSNMMWDRHLWETALYWQFQHEFRQQPLNGVKQFSEVFIGHTTTSWGISSQFNSYVPSGSPVRASNVWNLDTGAGWEGKLTIMNLDTEEWWQSDTVSELYENERGRR